MCRLSMRFKESAKKYSGFDTVYFGMERSLLRCILHYRYIIYIITIKNNDKRKTPTEEPWGSRIIYLL